MFKRTMAFFLALVMVLGMCGIPAYAEEDTELVPLEEPAPAEEPSAPDEDAEQEAAQPLSLEFTGAESVDDTGIARYRVMAEGDSLSLAVSAVSNGELSFRWQALNADGEYADIDAQAEPAALTASLSLAAADANAAEDAYRCVVTAVKDGETLTGYALFTVVIPAEEPVEGPAEEPANEPAEEPDAAALEGAQLEAGPAVTETGVTGELTWTFFENGQLLIAGVGAMPEYTGGGALPWAAYVDAITSLTVESGVSGISAGAFAGCGCLSSISFGHEVSDTLSIAPGAFALSAQLATAVTVPGGDGINPAISGYDWAGDCRSVTYLSLATGSVILKEALPATKVMIKIGEDTVAETGKTMDPVPLDICENGAVSKTPLALVAVVEVAPEIASDDIPVKWKSSNTAVAVVDADTGEVTYKACGTVTVTATAADGSGKSAAVKLICYYVNRAARLTAKAESEPVPSSGLQSGYTTTMVVYGVDADNKPLAIDAKYFEFSIPKIQAEIAAVTEDGLVTAGDKPGTATVNAVLNGDPLKRKVTLAVRVVPLLTTKLALTPPECEGDEYSLDGPDENDRYTMIFDKDKLGTSSAVFKFVLTPEAWGTGAGGGETPIANPSLLYTSSNSGIATVAVTKVDGKEVVTVSVKRTAAALGECVITGTAKDNSKIFNILTIRILDYKPRLGSSSLTFNPNFIEGVSTPLLSSYGNDITSVELQEYSAKDRDYVEATRLSGVFEDDKLTITQLPQENDKLIPNGTIKARLLVNCSNGEEYKLLITVTVKYAAPSVTVKQLSKFNLFYSDSEAELLATPAKGSTITYMGLKEHAVFDGFCNADETPDRLSVTYGVSPVYKAKPDVKLTVLVYFEGYTYPVEKALSLSTVTVKPSLYPARNSAVINTQQLDKSVSFIIYDKPDKKTPLELDSGAVTSEATFVELSNEGGTVTLSLVGSIGGTAKIDVQNGSWLQPISFNFNARAVDVSPTATLSTGLLKLNSVYFYGGDTPADVPEAIAAKAVLSLNQVNAKFAADIAVATTAAPDTATAAEAAKLGFIFNKDSGELKWYVKDSTVKNGTYAFIVTPQLEDGTTLNSLTLRVTVSTTLPTASLKSGSLKLNNVFTENTDSTELKLNRTIAVGEESTYVDRVIGDVDIEPTAKGAALVEANKLDVTYLEGIVIARIKDEFLSNIEADPETDTEAVTVPKAGTYSFKVTPKLENGDIDLSLKPIILKVVVTATVPKLTLATPNLRLNSAFAEDDIAASGININLNGYELTGLDCEPAAPARTEADKLTVEFLDADRSVTAQITSADDLPKAGTYSFILTPTVADANAQEAELSPLTLKVTVYSNASVSVSAASSGKLDAILRETSAITYTAAKLNNLNGKVEFVRLDGDFAELFDDTADFNEKGQTTVTLKLKGDESYATNLLYRLRLVFKVIKTDGTEADMDNIYSQAFSFKVSQSALKLKLSPSTQSAYLAHPTELKYRLELTNPEDAELQTAVTVNASTSLALRQALGENPIVYDSAVALEGDPDATNLTLDMTAAGTDMSKLKAGSSYTLVLDVRPVGCATNVKPTTVKTTIKVYR